MNKNDKVRLRFAPSPTGYLHVGGLRTALYNFFFAHQFDGALILRIEDTDQNRLVKNAEQNLINMLNWSGIQFSEGPHIGGDFGPYRQSERLNIYNKFYRELILNKKAYPCFYSDERLADLKTGKLSSQDATIEDEIFKNFNSDEVFSKMEEENFVVRLMIPNNQNLIHSDLIKGQVTFDLNLIHDPIIIKTDGFPTYHFANVIDDHLMNITHVIRGEEWLPSIPKHLILYQALNWAPPQFAHLPLLLNADKTKLSKRKNDVSVEKYIEKGYLKEALINFLALLGWHEKGDREIYNFDELINSFSLERVNKSGAIFDIQKLNAFNQHYIAQLSLSQIHSKIELPQDWVVTNEMITLIRDKCQTLNDFKPNLEFFFISELKLEEDILNELTTSSSINILESFLSHIDNINFNDSFILNDIVKMIQNDLNCTPKEIWQVLRLSLTGEKHGPSLESIILIYGFDKTQQRINAIIDC